MRAAPKKPALTGPLEKDIQAWILASLGTEVKSVDFLRSGRVKSLGYWVGKDSMWQRNNSAFFLLGEGDSKRAVRAGSKWAADIIGCCCGVAVALEVKRPGEKQTDEQKQWETLWTRAGGVYRVVSSPSEARAVVDEIRRRAA